MGKRSPILGYNHNVRYRGLVFHVQTEDSGVLSPHLFTHLFHGGVIVSTRKLVYDAGSNEEAIKALMQAQHKAVMKDLRKGAFDDKIDQYLGGTPGLEPRAAGSDRAKTEADPPLAVQPDSSQDLPVQPSVAHAPTTEILKSRTLTPGARGIPAADTLQGDNAAEVAAALAANAQTIRGPRSPTPNQAKVPTPAQAPRASGPPPTPSARAATPPIPRPPIKATLIDDEPVIELTIDDDSSRVRAPRDTDIEMPPEVAAALDSRVPGDSIPPLPPPPERKGPPSHGAAALPPARPVPRPASRPAIQAPTVVSRPVPRDESRERRDSDVIEVYSPPAPSIEPPPGERPGQYSVNRAKESTDVQMREQTGRVPVPAGLSRPRMVSGRTPPGGAPSTPASGAGRKAERSQPSAPARGAQRTPPVPEPAITPAKGRTPTPARVTAPIPARNPQAGSGVVMTRPAVIVGAPPKSPVPTPARVRKAREEESHGFGQGLISEKSLDEVILAYLSEDAEDK